MKSIGTTMLVALVCAIGLVACYKHGPDPKPHAHHSVEIAKDVCVVHALAEEHRTLTTRVGAIESGAPTTMRDESWTILMEKLRQYRAEIDATYRFVTANCTTYNLCMQTHHYREMECAGSRQAWTDSHTRFNQLALDLARLEKGHHPNHPHRGNPGKHCTSDCNIPPSDCRAVNCNVQGAVFSTGCCYDRD